MNAIASKVILVLFCMVPSTFGAHVNHHRHHQKRVYTEIVTSLEELKNDTESAINSMAGNDPLAKALLVPADIFLNGLSIFLESGKIFSEPADQITTTTIQGTVNALRFFANLIDPVLQSLHLLDNNFFGLNVNQLENMLQQLQKTLNGIIERFGHLLSNPSTTAAVPPQGGGNSTNSTGGGPIISNDITSPQPPPAGTGNTPPNPPGKRKTVHKHTHILRHRHT